jgi:hypothetical protein
LSSNTATLSLRGKAAGVGQGCGCMKAALGRWPVTG